MLRKRNQRPLLKPWKSKRKPGEKLPFGFPLGKWLRHKNWIRRGRPPKKVLPFWVEAYKERDTPRAFWKTSWRWKHIVEEMVAFSRGESLDESLEGFFRLFLNKDRSTILGIGTIPEVKKALKEAWWIEEDDVRQELDFYLFFKMRYGCRKMHPAMVARILGTNLRDYLMSQLIKSHEVEYEPQPFSWDAVDERLDREKHLSKLTFDLRYLYYLHFLMGMEREEIFPLFMYTPRAYNLMMLRLLEEIKGVTGAP